MSNSSPTNGKQSVPRRHLQLSFIVFVNNIYYIHFGLLLFIIFILVHFLLHKLK